MNKKLLKISNYYTLYIITAYDEHFYNIAFRFLFSSILGAP